MVDGSIFLGIQQRYIVDIYIYVYIYVYICMYMCMYVYMCMYIYVYIYVCICVCICIYIYTRKYGINKDNGNRMEYITLATMYDVGMCENG